MIQEESFNARIAYIGKGTACGGAVYFGDFAFHGGIKAGNIEQNRHYRRAFASRPIG